MPRSDGRATYRAQTLSGPQALIASARNFKTDPLPTTGARTEIKSEQWMKLAWEFYDVVPEFHYAVGWVGNLLSRAKLVVQENGSPTKNTQALELLDSLFNGPEGQSEMLRQLGIHFTVAGDSYIIGMDVGADKEEWFIAAASEIKLQADGTWKVGEEALPDGTLVMRLWRPHPQRRKYADSPTRAALPVLSEIDALGKHVAAQADSRLAGAGILMIPQEISFASVHQSSDGALDGAQAVSSPDELARELMEVMGTALEDRQSPEALVPIIIQAPGEHIGQVRHITFWSELNAAAKDLRTEAVKRLALGMDMPPEVLTGTGTMNHWNAWQMEESGVKAHTEPLLKVICDCLTDGYLRPLMDGDDVDSFSIVADTTDLRLRPNRSKEALELYDRGAISLETMIRENGFDVIDDIMADEELRTWFLRKVGSGSTTPDIVLAALRELGVPLDNIPQEPTQIQVRDTIEAPIGDIGDGSDPAKPTEAPSDPTLKEHPRGDPPSADKAAAGLQSAAHVLVLRALERAGNRMKSKIGGRLPGVAARDYYLHFHIDFAQTSMDDMLDDAWGFVDDIAVKHHVDPVWLQTRLDTFTRDLLQNRKQFDSTALAAHLAL